METSSQTGRLPLARILRVQSMQPQLQTLGIRVHRSRAHATETHTCRHSVQDLPSLRPLRSRSCRGPNSAAGTRAGCSHPPSSWARTCKRPARTFRAHCPCIRSNIRSGRSQPPNTLDRSSTRLAHTLRGRCNPSRSTSRHGTPPRRSSRARRRPQRAVRRRSTCKRKQS